MKRFSALAVMVSALISLGIAGCDTNDGPVEKTGESIDRAIDNTGDAIEDAGDEMRDKTN